MMDPRDAFIQQQRERLAQGDSQTQVAFEQTVVKQILRGTGRAPVSWAQAERECDQYTGQRMLNFVWMEAAYPNCPTRFAAAKIRGTHRIGLDELFNRFTRTSIYKAYCETADEREVDLGEEYLAFVFNWTPSKHTMVLHNYPRQDSYMRMAGSTDEDDSNTTRIVRPVGPHVFVIEALTSFLQVLKHAWPVDAI